MTKDKDILETIEGLRIPFVKRPIQKFIPETIAKSSAEFDVLNSEISTLIKKGAVEEINPEHGKFFSRLFTIPKSSGGLRPIINLRPLNQFVKIDTFKMEGLKDLKLLVSKGDYFTKIDLTDAYLTVPIAKAYQKYLAFSFNGRSFCFTVLPFGLNIAPERFTRIFKPVLSYLRQQAIKVLIWLDDILIISNNKNESAAHAKEVVNLLEGLGFLVNMKKSALVPSQRIMYLGMVLDSVQHTLELPREKILHIKSLSQDLLSSSLVTLRQLARFLGTCSATRHGVLEAPLHIRNIQRDLNRQLHLQSSRFPRGLPCKVSYGVKLSLSPSSREEILWWRDSLELCNPRPITFPPVDIIIHSDASNKGWGGHLDHLQVRGTWSREQESLHINVKELLAAFLTLKSFLPAQRCLHVQLCMDNKTAVTYVNKMGGTRSPVLCQLAVDMWKWCQERKIHLSAIFIPGVQNVEADRLSREVSISTELHLNSKVFRQIVAVYGMPEVDLFATAVNKQVSRYITWIPDPLALATDALTQDWGQFQLSYLFPPMNLISKCLLKIRDEKAKAILVTPVWKSRPWYPVLLTMLRDRPLLLPPYRDLVAVPQGHQAPRFLTKDSHLRLAAWPVSGDPLTCSKFQKGCPKYYPHHGGKAQKLITPHRGDISVAGVTQNRKIQFLVL